MAKEKEQKQPAELNELEVGEDTIGPGVEPRVSDIQPKCVLPFLLRKRLAAIWSALSDGLLNVQELGVTVSQAK